MGIPFSITLAIWVRVTEDAHITRVLGMGMPISLRQRKENPSFIVLRTLLSCAYGSKKLGEGEEEGLHLTV